MKYEHILQMTHSVLPTGFAFHLQCIFHRSFFCRCCNRDIINFCISFYTLCDVDFMVRQCVP